MKNKNPEHPVFAKGQGKGLDETAHHMQRRYVVRRMASVKKICMHAVRRHSVCDEALHGTAVLRDCSRMALKIR